MAEKSLRSLTLEAALKELEGIVAKLENNDVTIDEGFALFERGTKLSKFCNEKLSGYERKIQMVKVGGKGKSESKETVRLELFDGVEEDEAEEE